MILPVSHEEGATRRWPWVTFGIMAFCLVVLLFTDDTAIETEEGPGFAMEEAAEFFREHAYLDAQPKLREHVAYDVMPNQRRQYLETLSTLSERNKPDTLPEIAEQQAKLDRLTDRALGLVNIAPAQQNPYQRWGVVPNDLQGHTLLTYMFMHAGWLHLIGNLFMLLVMGPAIEDRWGRLTYTGLYLFTGLFAALVYLGMAKDTVLPMVGASGAIAGVLGAFVVRLWKTKIKFGYFFLLVFKPIYGTFEAAAWVMLPLWFANELFQAMLFDSLGFRSGVAYWAHVGGFIGGVGFAFAVKAAKIEENIIHPAVEAEITVFEANPVLESAMEARQQGDLAGAMTILEGEFAKNPDEDISLALWDLALNTQQPEKGAAALNCAIRAAAKRGDLELALRHWSELSDHVPTALVDSGTLVRMVPQLLEENQKDRAVLALKQIVHPDNVPLTPGLAMRVVEMARELEPAAALAAATVAMASPDIHEAKREKLAGLVAELEAEGVEVPQVEAGRAELIPEEPEVPWDEGGVVDIARFREAKFTEARPVRLGEGKLHVVLDGDREAAVSFAKIQAIAVGAISDAGPKPVLMIDLLANWNDSEGEVLRGIRLCSNQFDPRKLMGAEESAKSAFSSFVVRLMEACGAVPLPSAHAVRGNPFSRFDTLADYEREVLEVSE